MTTPNSSGLPPTPGGPQDPYAAQSPPAGLEHSWPHPAFGPGGSMPPPGPPSIPTQRNADGYPYYPGTSGVVMPPRNGLGTTALVLGIVGLLFSFLPIVGVIAWPMVIPGLIFGLLGISRARAGSADNLGVAAAGTVLSGLGLVVCMIWVVAFGSAVSSAPATGGTGTTSAGSSVAPGSSGSGNSSSSGGASPGAFPGATSNDVVGNAGQTVTVGDVEVSAGPLRPGDSTFGSTLCSTVTYRNTGSSSESFNGLFDWKLQTPSGAVANTGLFGSDSDLRSGQLVPGGTTRGDVCFERTYSETGRYVVLYDPLGFSTGRGAWLNQVG